MLVTVVKPTVVAVVLSEYCCYMLHLVVVVVAFVVAVVVLVLVVVDCSIEVGIAAGYCTECIQLEHIGVVGALVVFDKDTGDLLVGH